MARDAEGPALGVRDGVSSLFGNFVPRETLGGDDLLGDGHDLHGESGFRGRPGGIDPQLVNGAGRFFAGGVEAADRDAVGQERPKKPVPHARRRDRREYERLSRQRRRGRSPIRERISNRYPASGQARSSCRRVRRSRGPRRGRSSRRGRGGRRARGNGRPRREGRILPLGPRKAGLPHRPPRRRGIRSRVRKASGARRRRARP